MARSGHAIWPHESRPFAAGGNVVVSLSDIPPKMEALGVLIRLTVGVVQGAGAPAILGDNLFRIFAAVAIDGIPGVTPTIQCTGKFLHFLEWHMRGVQLNQPADVPAAGAGTYSRTLNLWIPFADLESANIGDCATPAELFKNTPLRISFGDPQVVFNVNTTFAAGSTVRVLTFYRPWSPGALPSVPLIKFEDWNQQTVLLGGKRAYTHLFAYSEAGDVTDANYNTFSLYADGRAIKPLLQTGELATEFNLMVARGGSMLQRGVVYVPAGAGFASPGEAINAEPSAPGVGGGAGITVPFIPLLSPPNRYKLTQVVHPDQSMRIDYTGALTTLRFGYRCITESNRSAVVQMGNLLGIPSPESRQLTSRQMKRGGPVSARQSLILPKRMAMTQAEVLANGGETGIQS